VSRIRVLVVDDSIVARRIVTDALAGDPQIEVIGTAANGQVALAMVEQLAPDLVTMDIEMPVLDGIETVRALRRRGDRTPIIMFATLNTQGAMSTFSALAAGATDFVTKPASMTSAAASFASVAQQLVPKVKALVPRPGPARTTSRTLDTGPAIARTSDQIRLAAPPEGRVRPVRVVVVGASMGGPEAVSHILRRITPLPVPMVLVQHMPSTFTAQFAARLDRVCASKVLESAGEEELAPGHVYIAPGDHHLELRASGRGVRTVLQTGPPVNFCRPSVDTMFSSAVGVYGGDLLAVVLSGMGTDGRAGSEAVVAAGGTVLVQDEASSVVWGMPGSVAKAGFAHRMLPLQEMCEAIVTVVKRVDTGALAPRGSAR